MLKAISRSLLSFVFPLSCELCESLLPAAGRTALCRRCEAALPLSGLPAQIQGEHFHFDQLFAASLYENGVKKLLRAFKFHRRLLLRLNLVRLLERRLETIPDKPWDVVAAVPMPVPLQRERGFNQAELLARGVSSLIQKPFLKNALGLTGPLKQQSKLGKTERRENVHRRFLAKKDVFGKSVLLVDDILTTGQTASECARALKEGGARSVDVLVVARSV